MTSCTLQCDPGIFLCLYVIPIQNYANGNNITCKITESRKQEFKVEMLHDLGMIAGRFSK